jgi:hypothetical protein
MDENVARTAHPKIFRGRIVPTPKEAVEQALARLAGLVEAGGEGALREYLSSLIPDAQLDQAAAPGAEVVPMVRRRKERESG